MFLLKTDQILLFASFVLRVMDASNKSGGTVGTVAPPPVLPAAAAGTAVPPALPSTAVGVLCAPPQLPAAAACSVPFPQPSVVVPSLQQPPTVSSIAASEPAMPPPGEMDIQRFVEAVVQGRASISHTVDPSEIPRSQKKIGLLHTHFCMSLQLITTLWLKQQGQERLEQCSGLCCRATACHTHSFKRAHT